MEMVEIIMTIAGGSIMLLIGIVGYFLRKIHSTLEELSSQVGCITTDMAVSKSRIQSMQKDCESRDSEMKEKLKEHSKCIYSIKKKLARLEK